MPVPKVNTSNLVYLVICVIGIAAFFLVGIYPNMQSLDELDADVTSLTQRVQSQELLYPIYRQLIKEVQQPITTKLILPVTDSLSQKDLNQINELFAQVARQCDVDFVRAVPDASSYLDDADHLSMYVTFTGDFFNFRKLLFELCALPYLEAIDQMRVEADSAEKSIVLKLRLVQN